MDTSRRTFLKTGSLTALGAAAWVGAPRPNLLAAPKSNSRAKDKPTLIVVYLRGGADPLATIVPYNDQQLRQVRPSLALAGPDSSDPNKVLPLDEMFGFNPKMQALHDLYLKKMVAPIVCVGSPHPTRSHFDAQDFMERAAPGQRNVTKGWLSQYLTETASDDEADLRAFALQPLLPRSLRGDYPVLARPDQQAELAMAMYSHLYPDREMSSRLTAGSLGQETQKKIRDFGQRTITQLEELNKILERPLEEKAAYPDTRFGRQFRDLTKVINADVGLEITALDYLGWDHHINEGPINGQLGRMIGDVSDSTGALFANLKPEKVNNTMVLLMSEFGRTVRENGNQGSDHGHGGFMMAIGGRVKGGQVYGTWTGLEKDKLYQRRDLPVHTDFRLVFAEVMSDLYGFDGMALGMFPQFTADSGPLDFLT